MGHYIDLYVNKGNEEAYRDNEKRDYLRKTALTAKEVVQGIILPAKGDPSVSWALGGVLDKDDNFIKESRTKNEYVFGGFYEYDKNSVQQYDETVVFMGPFICHWGHFICDQISRLWYVLPDIKKYRVAYCGWNWGSEQTSLWGNFLEFMHLLGLSDDQLIDVKTPMQFRSVIIPEFSFIPNEYYIQNYFTEEFKDIFRIVTGNVKTPTSTAPSHIYFTRGKFSGAMTKEYGEDKIEALFEANGYKIFSPEQLSLSEQIYYLNHSECMAAVSGSITHNFLFAKIGQKVIVLNKMDSVNEYQMLIDNIMDVNISCIDVYKKMLPVCFGLGPFLIGVNGNLKRFLKDSNMTLPAKLRFNPLAIIRGYVWYLYKYAIIYTKKSNLKNLRSQIRYSKIQKSLNKKRKAEEKL
jgi:hypothetical protein